MRKRLMAVLLAIVCVFGSSMPVFAAPKKMSDGGLFDAQYYAQNNPDVTAVFGNSEKALYSHYKKYGQKEGRQPYDPAGTAAQTTAAVTSEVSIVGEYSYVSYGWTYHFIVVQNNTDLPLSVQANTVAYNAAGAIVGAETGSLSVIRKGHNELITEMFDGKLDAGTTYKTTLSTRKSYYEDAAVSVALTPQVTSDGCIVTATNLGTIPAEFFNVRVLFLKNGQVVDDDYHYMVDADDELKPGASYTEEFDFYSRDAGTFDQVLCFSEGRYYNG